MSILEIKEIICCGTFDLRQDAIPTPQSYTVFQFLIDRFYNQDLPSRYKLKYCIVSPYYMYIYYVCSMTFVHSTHSQSNSLRPVTNHYLRTEKIRNNYEQIFIEFLDQNCDHTERKSHHKFSSNYLYIHIIQVCMFYMYIYCFLVPYR